MNRTLRSSLAFFALLSSLAVGCAAPAEETEDGDSALASQENSASAASAAAALKELLANPDRMAYASAPVAEAGGYTFYAQPSVAAIEKKASLSADEPVTEFVAFNGKGDVLYVNVATGGIAGVSPDNDLKSNVSPSGIQVQNVATELVAAGTKVVFEEVVTIIRKVTVTIGEATVGTVSHTADEAAEGAARAATEATTKLADTTPKVYAAASSKVKGDPSTIRGLTDGIVTKLKADVPGTVAIGADEAANLLKGQGRSVYVKKMEYNLRGQTKRAVEASGKVRIAVEGVSSVEADGLRRVTITSPDQYRGLAGKTDDAIVGAGFYENQALAQSLADEIIVADLFTGISGPQNIRGHIHDALANVRQRMATGRSPEVTLKFVGTSHSLPTTAENVRETLAGLRSLPEAAHLRFDFAY